MAYDQTVPATGHSGSQDYTPIRNNFVQLQTSFSVNHEPLGSGGATEGFHTKIQIPAVIADPGLASPMISLYTKTFGGASQLFFQNGALAANVVQLTGSITNGNNSTGQTEYTIPTPFGLILKFGIVNAASGTTSTYATAFPTNGFGVVVTPRQSTGAGFTVGAAVAGVNGTTGFTFVFGNANPQALYFIAWGN